MDSGRMYDVVVFGATGFTGRLVAEYLADRSRFASFRWAIAGRSAEGLARAKAAITASCPAMERAGMVVASADDPASLSRMASRARVVLSTVGPFFELGEPLVDACIRERTDLVDITGEPDFVDLLLDRYDAPARRAGVRVVNCCGFESVPLDLGALFTAGHLPATEPLAIEAFVSMKGWLSGGTWQSALGAFGDALKRKPGRPRWQGAGGRKVKDIRRGVRFDPGLGAWVCPMFTIDPEVVLRSARALDARGPDFSYGQYLVVRTAAELATMMGTVSAVMALAQLRTTRDLLRRARASGEGPTAEQRSRGSFDITFRAESTSASAVTRVSGGEPGYTETAKMVSESALCLALDHDRLSPRAGVLTPAAAMGQALTDRLIAAGIRFEVLERSG